MAVSHFSSIDSWNIVSLNILVIKLYFDIYYVHCKKWIDIAKLYTNRFKRTNEMDTNDQRKPWPIEL